MDGKKPICFWKDLVTNWTDPSGPTKWLPFEIDKAIGKVKDLEKAGLFSLRLYVHEAHSKGEINKD